MEQTPKEWADRILQNFGRRKPVGIELRGDGTAIYYNLNEVALVRIYLATKNYYRKNEMAPDKILESQERTIHILGGGFNIDMEPELSESTSNYDFVPRPEWADSYYTVGLADLIFITDIDELPYLLDFQFYNHVIAEKSERVRFLQLLHFHVVHLLKTRYSVVPTKQLRLFQKWIYGRVSNLDAVDTKKFYWYQAGYEWKELEDSQPQNESNSAPLEQLVANTDISGSKLLIENDAVESKEIPLKRVNFSSILKYSCTKQQLERYFGLLKQDNPTKGGPMLNAEAVDWMIGYYFEVNGPCTLSNKPDFIVNISQQELMYFIHCLSAHVSPKIKHVESSPKHELSRILTECFTEIFGKNNKSLSTRLKRETATWNSSVTQLIDTAIERRYPKDMKAKSDGLGKSKVEKNK